MVDSRKGMARGAAMVALLGAIAATPAWAGGGESSPDFRSWSGNADPVVTKMQAFTAQKDYTGAAAYMKDALAKNPQSADYNNLYAYSVRKGPNPDMALVLKHYNEALRLDPKHRATHEYIGEAYLMMDNPAKAKEHLAALDRLCTFGCEEFTDLKKAIAEYDAKKN